MPTTRAKKDEEEEEEEAGSFASCESDADKKDAEVADDSVPGNWGMAGPDDAEPSDDLPSSWGMESQSNEPEQGAGRLAGLKSMLPGLPGFRGAAAAPTGTTLSEEDDDIPEALRPQVGSEDLREAGADIASALREEAPSHWGVPEVEAADEVSSFESPEAAGPLSGLRGVLTRVISGSGPPSPEKKPLHEPLDDDDDIPESLRPKLVSEGAQAELAKASAEAAEEMPSHWGAADVEENEEEPAAVPSQGRLAGLRAAAGRLAGVSASADVAAAAPLRGRTASQEVAAKRKTVHQYDMPEIDEEEEADVPSHWGLPAQDDDDDDEEKVATPSPAQGIGSRLAGLTKVIPGLRGRTESQEAAVKLVERSEDVDDDDIPENMRSKQLSAEAEAKVAEALDSAAEEMPGHWGMAQADDGDVVAAAVKNLPSQCESMTQWLEASEESPVDVPSNWGTTELPDEEPDAQQAPAGGEGRLGFLKRVISARLPGSPVAPANAALAAPKTDEEIAAIMAASAEEDVPLCGEVDD